VTAFLIENKITHKPIFAFVN